MGRHLAWPVPVVALAAGSRRVLERRSGEQDRQRTTSCARRHPRQPRPRTRSRRRRPPSTRRTRSSRPMNSCGSSRPSPTRSGPVTCRPPRRRTRRRACRGSASSRWRASSRRSTEGRRARRRLRRRRRCRRSPAGTASSTCCSRRTPPTAAPRSPISSTRTSPRCKHAVADVRRSRRVDVAVGAAELIEEVSEGKITGEEDRYSKTDLWDFDANLQGSQAAIEQAEARAGGSRSRASRQDRRPASPRSTPRCAPLRRGDGWVLVLHAEGPVPVAAVHRGDRDPPIIDKLKAQLAGLSENVSQVAGVLKLT